MKVKYLKKKIMKKTLVIAIVSLLLLTGISTASTINIEKKETNKEIDDGFVGTEITLYVYFDKNNNGHQDFGEYHATNAFVFVTGWLSTLTPWAKVNPVNGEAKLKIPDTVNIKPIVYAHVNGPAVVGYLSSNQYKTSKEFSSELEDGQYIKIGMAYHKKKVKNIEKPAMPKSNMPSRQLDGSKITFRGTAILGLSFTAGIFPISEDPYFLIANVYGEVSEIKNLGIFGLMYSLKLRGNNDFIEVSFTSSGRGTRRITIAEDSPEAGFLTVTGVFIPNTVDIN
jgi:hypothetical protein